MVLTHRLFGLLVVMAVAFPVYGQASWPQDGTIDMKSWDFEQDGPKPFASWELIPGKLLEPWEWSQHKSNQNLFPCRLFELIPLRWNVLKPDGTAFTPVSQISRPVRVT